MLSSKTKKYTCRIMQFCGGGAGYGLIEILWRGYTHFSMLAAGGICFLLLVKIAKTERGFLAKSMIGGLCITVVEFIAGCVVNLMLGLAVWDYTHMPLSFMGQICLGYTLLWISLSAIVLLVIRLTMNSIKHVREINHKKSERLSAQ